jgi:hypothetical protein
MKPVIGIPYDRYVKFDTFHPAVDKGLPVTRVVSRVALQEVLASYVRKQGGDTAIENDCHVVSALALNRNGRRAHLPRPHISGTLNWGRPESPEPFACCSLHAEDWRVDVWFGRLPEPQQEGRRHLCL